MSITITQTKNGHRLVCSQRIPRPREEVFAFFADATNLERITPPSLRFHILTPLPLEMREGLLIDYRLRVHGVPIRWRSEIAAWEPPGRFVDRQVRGPYRKWVHEHRFTDLGDATDVEDAVEYAVPGGRLVHALVHALMVGRDVRRIFEHRSRVLRELFGDGDRR